MIYLARVVTELRLYPVEQYFAHDFGCFVSLVSTVAEVISIKSVHRRSGCVEQISDRL